jgi:ribonuclease HII
MAPDLQKLSIIDIRKLLDSLDEKQQKKILGQLANDRRVGVQKLLAQVSAWHRQQEKCEEEFQGLCSFEIKLRNRGFVRIAGVDEAGRGAFAGPLVAAAVILPAQFHLPGLRESKQLTPRMREEYYEIILERALDWSAEVVPPSVIDEKGLHKANLHALEQAALSLCPSPDFVISDGFPLPDLQLPKISIAQGDTLSISIAAASVIAKVQRDRMMVSYSKEFPWYGFEKHKGYGTKEHLEVLEDRGPCPIHRASFKRVADFAQLDLGDL